MGEEEKCRCESESVIEDVGLELCIEIEIE